MLSGGRVGQRDCIVGWGGCHVFFLGIVGGSVPAAWVMARDAYAGPVARCGVRGFLNWRVSALSLSVGDGGWVRARARRSLRTGNGRRGVSCTRLAVVCLAIVFRRIFYSSRGWESANRYRWNFDGPVG